MRLDRTSLAGARTAYIYEGWIARTHDAEHPLVYSTGEEYRDADELNNILRQVQACASFKTPVVIPTTLLHPSTLLRFGAEDANVVGRVLDGRLDEDHVIARILIEDPQAVAAIEAGVFELSLGYTADLTEDRYQVSIILDHLSIVPAGRCGTCELNPVRADGCEVNYRRDLGGVLTRVASAVPDANLDSSMKVGQLTAELSLRLDEKSEGLLAQLERLGVTAADLKGAVGEKSDCGCSVEHSKPACSACTIRANLLNKESHVMDELKAQLAEALKALETEKAAKVALEAELANAKSDANKAKEEAEKAKADAELAAEKMELKVSAAKADADKLVEELAATKTKLEEAEKAKADAQGEAFEKRVDAKVELLANAARAGIEDARAKADRDLKVAIYEKVTGKTMKSDASEAYIEARYEMAMELLEESGESIAAVRGAIKDHEDKAKTANTTNLDEEAERLASIKRREERFAGKKKD